jgi:hypothetical protein
LSGPDEPAVGGAAQRAPGELAAGAQGLGRQAGEVDVQADRLADADLEALRVGLQRPTVGAGLEPEDGAVAAIERCLDAAGLGVGGRFAGQPAVQLGHACGQVGLGLQAGQGIAGHALRGTCVGALLEFGGARQRGHGEAAGAGERDARGQAKKMLHGGFPSDRFGSRVGLPATAGEGESADQQRRPPSPWGAAPWQRRARS